MGLENFLKNSSKPGHIPFPGLKVTNPSPRNAYLGLKPSLGAGIGLTIGAVAWGVKSSGVAVSDFTDNQSSYPAEETGSLPMMNAEGKGNVLNGQDFLGTLGETVFFMHNVDRGSKIR